MHHAIVILFQGVLLSQRLHHLAVFHLHKSYHCGCSFSVFKADFRDNLRDVFQLLLVNVISVIFITFRRKIIRKYLFSHYFLSFYSVIIPRPFVIFGNFQIFQRIQRHASMEIDMMSRKRCIYIIHRFHRIPEVFYIIESHCGSSFHLGIIKQTKNTKNNDEYLSHDNLSLLKADKFKFFFSFRKRNRYDLFHIIIFVLIKL